MKKADGSKDICNSKKEEEQVKDESSRKPENVDLKDANVEPPGLSENDEGIERRSGFLAGIFHGCLKPVCGFLVKKNKSDKDPWMIPFNALTEIRLVGSGAQGAVFLGHYKNEEVAIKKVKNERDTDIRHLRHLDHKNIVKFRYFSVSLSPLSFTVYY